MLACVAVLTLYLVVVCVVALTQGWQQVTSQFTALTKAVVLARPIPDPSKVCPVSAMMGTAPTSTSQSSSSQPAAAASCGTSQPSGCSAVGELQLQGSVDIDNCCSGAAAGLTHDDHTHTAHPHHDGQHMQSLARSMVASQDDSAAAATSCSSGSEEDSPAPRSRRRFLRRQEAAAKRAAAAQAADRTPTTQYYGLAVQALPQGFSGSGAGPSEACSGCYVLKLSRNKDITGCTCTMFTLTRVCQGQPLHTQLQQSWLAQ